MARDPCVSIGWGGPDRIDNDLDTAHFTWLPKGYGPSADMFVICLVRIPPDEVHNGGKTFAESSKHPLLLAVKDTIENYMRKRRISVKDQ